MAPLIPVPELTSGGWVGYGRFAEAPIIFWLEGAYMLAECPRFALEARG